MTPESFTGRLQSVLGDQLVAAILYGSAAAGERSEKYSDYNVLVVCQQLGQAELDAMSPISIEWSQCGNPPPLLFTRERLRNSSDVFPIELLDIKETHEMLFGDDVLKELPIGKANLRFQLEHEIKGKLIQLRESYLLTGGDASDVLDLMVRSLSAFQVLLRAMLRFYEVAIPGKKRDAVRQLAKHLSFDMSVFDDLQKLKDGDLTAKAVDARDIFKRYLVTIERIADLVDHLGRR